MLIMEKPTGAAAFCIVIERIGEKRLAPASAARLQRAGRPKKRPRRLFQPFRKLIMRFPAFSSSSTAFKREP